MFDIDGFVEACLAAKSDSEKAMREVVRAAVGEPGNLMAALGEPAEAGIETLHRSDDLTILNVVWAPLMTVRPHDHRMWAVIGIYAGGEDNVFWRRIPGGIEAAGARSMREGDAVPLGRDIVHSVTNPVEKLTGAIHVYGGDFFGTARSEWDAETLAERPYSVENTRRLFSEANARYRYSQQTAG
jgi:predicted metal-dependent enzyme (double-stranded beta helix superfamily)